MQETASQLQEYWWNLHFSENYLNISSHVFRPLKAKQNICVWDLDWGSCTWSLKMKVLDLRGKCLVTYMKGESYETMVIFVVETPMNSAAYWHIDSSWIKCAIVKKKKKFCEKHTIVKNKLDLKLHPMRAGFVSLGTFGCYLLSPAATNWLDHFKFQNYFRDSPVKLRWNC